MNNTKLFKVLKWKPSIDLDQGCMKILKHHKIKSIKQNYA